MRVLVTAATRHGATQGIAEAIGRTLAGKGLTVQVLPIDEVSSIVEYDAVVLGSAKRATRLAHLPEGDFRPWGEIETWAYEIGATLMAGSATQA
jgi:flavodoxin